MRCCWSQRIISRSISAYTWCLFTNFTPAASFRSHIRLLLENTEAVGIAFASIARENPNPWKYGTGPTRLPLLSFVIGLSFDYLTIFGGSRGLFFGIEYKFNSIICILYIYIYIYKDKRRLLYYFSRNSPWGGFCCFACSPLLRPPLALVGDGHPDSHVTDASAG